MDFPLYSPWIYFCNYFGCHCVVDTELQCPLQWICEIHFQHAVILKTIKTIKSSHTICFPVRFVRGDIIAESLLYYCSDLSSSALLVRSHSTDFDDLQICGKGCPDLIWSVFYRVSHLGAECMIDRSSAHASFLEVVVGKSCV